MFQWQHPQRWILWVHAHNAEYWLLIFRRHGCPTLPAMLARSYLSLLTNPQPATQNFGCSYNVSFGTSQTNSFNVGVNSSAVINAGATFGQGTSQSTTQGCTSDQVDTSVTAQTCRHCKLAEYRQCLLDLLDNFFNNNWQSGDPRGVVGACPTGPPPQSTGNYSSCKARLHFSPQDTTGFAGILNGSALVEAGGTCREAGGKKDTTGPLDMESTDHQMQSSFQLIFTANAPEITVQACTQAFNPSGAALNSQQCAPTYSSDPSTWWQGQSTALALQTCAYQTNYNPVITLNTFSTIPPPWLIGVANGGQNLSSWGSSNTSSSSSSTFSSPTNLAYAGAAPSWTSLPARDYRSARHLLLLTL